MYKQVIFLDLRIRTYYGKEKEKRVNRNYGSVP